MLANRSSGHVNFFKSISWLPPRDLVAATANHCVQKKVLERAIKCLTAQKPNRGLKVGSHASK